MKTLSIGLALAVLTGAGTAVAGQVEILNCNQQNAWLNAYAYNEKDAVRIVAASDFQALKRGHRVVLTCATGRCAVALEFPKYLDETTASFSSSTVYNFSGNGGGIDGRRFVGVADRVCSKMRYDASGANSGIDYSTDAGCSC